VQLLRALIDLFPVCGSIAAIASLIGGLTASFRSLANTTLACAGLVPLIAWAIGLRQLPPGSSPEIGLWLIGLGALAILVGLAIELRQPPEHVRTRPLNTEADR
jgi:hypothetical protein